MASNHANPNDPLAFVRNLWSGMGFNLPGMVAPTFDVEELDKRIKDMKAVEGWLRMNLSMLQMTIQSLEMQRTTVSTVQAMSKMAAEAGKPTDPSATADTSSAPSAGAFSEASMWPWQMMQQIRAQMEQQAAATESGAAATAEKTAPPPKK